jgi:hypothetical protein
VPYSVDSDAIADGSKTHLNLLAKRRPIANRYLITARTPVSYGNVPVIFGANEAPLGKLVIIAKMPALWEHASIAFSSPALLPGRDVAVALKLAILLYRRWVTGAPSRPAISSYVQNVGQCR